MKDKNHPAGWFLSFRRPLSKQVEKYVARCYFSFSKKCADKIVIKNRVMRNFVTEMCFEVLTLLCGVGYSSVLRCCGGEETN